jgi:nitrogen fixation protein FixH
LIFVLLGGQLLLMFVMVYLAISDGSFAIEPDYYQKGLNWDDTAAQLRNNQRLGWKADVQVGEDVSVLSERTVSCSLTDQAGRGLDGAEVELEAFPHVRGSERATVALSPAGNGLYQAKLRFGRKGVWEFRFVARRGPETFTHTELIEVYPPQDGQPWRR